MEMFYSHLNYKLNWSIFFSFNCTCEAKPLAGQSEQTWHSVACAVNTEDKTVRVWGPLHAFLSYLSITFSCLPFTPQLTGKYTQYEG